ncbi:hypothetical protein RAZWK3B_04947 [Roseobacter sp. AzwK-3b]|uniref:DUF4139 domain-containing protein n=1 Tax=Roseobacter sp. AzwK-3b TaxID=351016 RepID=UPI000156A944|nr:DUF4139 domain-containing protein [Roseobacter sp. AzwK-3b]EDM70464.1 hypothetical protein RAZWK3B_04947 [Roseobacter sp. AzwK-3b]
MRALACLLIVAPVLAWAEDIPVTSRVTDVTLYPQGGTVIREAGFAAPQGSHRLILTDLPVSVPLSSVRVSVEGAQLNDIALRDDDVPPRSAEETAALQAARAEVARLEAALRDAEAGVEAIRLEEEAAVARVAFLDQLGTSRALAGMDPAALRDLVTMIGQEGLAARQAALEARQRADAADRGLGDLRDDLEEARAALRALVPEDAARAMLAVAITADADTQGMVRVAYTVPDAGWQPAYDVRLDRDAARLSIARGAFLQQSTGENWQDVALTLSTSRPSEQTAPSEIWPWLRRVFDPDQMQPKTLSRGAEASFDSAAPQAESMAAPAPAMITQAAPEFDGLSVRYVYPGTVSVASGADRVRVDLGLIERPADPIARAVPLLDDRAFLMAGFTNDDRELILPTDEARFYLDERFVGQRPIAMIPAGAEAELSFGPIDGLRLTRMIPSREEGGRGVFTASNALEETIRIEVENLTAEPWPLRVLDRVPYSEQQELEIDWTAAPRPAAQDVDGKRGVLEWRFTLEPAATQEIVLDYTLEWPEGKLLR